MNALSSNTTGSYNTANGYEALYYNTTGSSNVANGVYALALNTSGHTNTATGAYAIYSNSIGTYNTASGALALYYNTEGSHNIANGYQSLYFNTTGNYNVAEGSYALQNNTGSYNVSVGTYALTNNTTGAQNTAAGYDALDRNYTSWGNTVLGYKAGSNYANGYYNTFIGSQADATTQAIYNSTALGNTTYVSAPNQVRIGNSYITSIGGYTNWSNISDGRVKKNVKENVPGLAFINKLKPLTYNLDLDAADKIIEHPTLKDKDGKLLTYQPSQTEINARTAKQQVIYTGFVAQDVEKAAKELNFDFSGVDAAKSDKDLYALGYSDFVVPLVKAVQDLSKMNDDKDRTINDLKTRVEKLEAMMNVKESSGVTSAQSSKIASASSASLEQNMPNPFNRSTTIKYTLPQRFSSAKIIVTDKSGKTLKEINVSGTDKGSLIADASTLSGSYQYSFMWMED